MQADRQTDRKRTHQRRAAASLQVSRARVARRSSGPHQGDGHTEAVCELHLRHKDFSVCMSN